MKSKGSVIIQLVTIMLLSLFIFGSQNLYARDARDIILVLDTSLSMKGYGGKDIFGRVKGRISKYIDEVHEGDKLTFMTFDTKVRSFQSILIDDENDRKIAKSFISATEADGKWTYTFRMIQTVFEKADEIEKESDDEDRKTLIVIMTDALDDPPPGMKTDRLNVKKITGVTQRERWVFYMNFSTLKDSKETARVRARIQKELEKGATHVKFIKGDVDPEKAIDDMESETRDMGDSGSGPVIPILIALLVIACIIGVLIYLRRQGQLKVKGKLEYWKGGVINPYISTYGMTKKQVHEITIGKAVGCTLNIRDIEISAPFGIAAVRNKGIIRFQLQSGGNYTIEYVNKSGSEEYLEDGDIFSVGNYTFKYFSES